MTNDPRSALNRLIAALEAHLDAAVTGDDRSPAVVAAESALQDAFIAYDDVLFTAYGIELPFDTFDADEEDDDYDDDDDDYDEDDDYDDEDGDYEEDDDYDDEDDGAEDDASRR
ncbi:DNA primase [Actinomyces sp. oral taxon 897]|uniref:DNA primase n=1 Tax=Actinomyces sp. oral taxon 897 TaxID=2081702 RepID=UPI000D0464EC|nr:DNA primase [Actinomyces sp. oral taxon 897]AVM61348.1 DNA primase [Actinomyces sp. oral taxon 897]